MSNGLRGPVPASQIQVSGMYHKPDGVPFRGDPNYPLDPDVPAAVKPQLAVEAVTKIFDLSVSADLEEYSKLMQEEAFGHLIIRHEDRQVLPEKQSWKVFVVAWRFVEELPRDIVERKRRLYERSSPRTRPY